MPKDIQARAAKLATPGEESVPICRILPAQFHVKRKTRAIVHANNRWTLSSNRSIANGFRK